MNKLALQEFEKQAASGIIGDLLTLGFAGKLLSKGIQQVKGFKEALKAGATTKEMLHADPLPVGKEWKYEKLTPIFSHGISVKNLSSNQMPLLRHLKISDNHLKAPFEGKSSYEHHIDKQQDLASTVAMPFGLGLSLYGTSKLKKQKKNEIPAVIS